MKKTHLPLSARSLRLAARLGVGGALAALAGVMMVLSGALALALLEWLEPDQALPGALLAGVTALLVTPLAGALVLLLMARLERTAMVLADLAQPVGPGAAQNRRQFLANATREWVRCKRHQEDAALLLIDADEYAALRQTRGEECVEALMRDVVRVVADTLRQSDLLARFGGEGLAVYLPRTDPLGALDVAERVRAGIAATGLRWNGAPVRTTASVGVASVSAEHAGLDEVIQEAGVALQQAREAGRNCVRATPLKPRRSDEQRPVEKR